MENNPKYEVIDLDRLVLDPENPRLPKSMHNKGEEEIIEFMLLDASLIELMLAIGENDFFPGEQLLVVPAQNRTYKVIEGNRRLSAVKLLNNPQLGTVQKQKIEKVLEEVKYKPTQIPCLVFNSENEIHNYLGYRHITGIKEWRLLEKARYLDNLRRQTFKGIGLNQVSREIAKIIGSRSDYVRRLLVGFEIYRRIEDEKFYKLKDVDDTTFHFNYIADSLNKNNIYKFLGVDWEAADPAENVNEANLKKWTLWLFEKNEQNRTRLIGNSADLTKLNKILGNETALDAFDTKAMDLDRAYELTEDLAEIFADSIKNSLRSLEQADSISHRVLTFYDELEEDLLSIRKLTSKIKKVKESDDEEKF